MAWLVGFPLVFITNLHRMLPLVGLKISTVMKSIVLPMLAAAGMYACVGIMRPMLSAGLSPVVLMVALIAAGAAGYVLVTVAVNRHGAREVVDLLRRKRAGNETQSEPN
jgi:hypothetical protein